MDAVSMCVCVGGPVGVHVFLCILFIYFFAHMSESESLSLCVSRSCVCVHLPASTQLMKRNLLICLHIDISQDPLCSVKLKPLTFFRLTFP